MSLALALALISVQHVSRPDLCEFEQTVASMPVTFVGQVILPRGLPARDATVVTSAGGEVATSFDGGFELSVNVPLDGDGVEVTATLEEGELHSQLVASTRISTAALMSVTSVGRLALVPAPVCSPRWRGTFGGMPGTDGTPSAMTVFDDGTGPALYVVFDYGQSAGGVPAEGLVRWDGGRWSAIDGAVDGGVHSLIGFDDGTGPAIYAAGSVTSAEGVFVNRIAKWNGASWSALGSGLDFFAYALAVFDDGGGPALYVAGDFTSAGGVPASRIAKWNGASWSALGSGLNGEAAALAVFDDGSGPALYVGGGFSVAGGLQASGLAKWNGTSWSAAGSFGFVSALTVFDDGSGPALCCAAVDTSTDEGFVARKQGATWSVLGGRMNASVQALTGFDDGSGPKLVACGPFSRVGASLFLGFAQWDGSSWSALGAGITEGSLDVPALIAFDDGSGPSLFACGGFVSVDRIGVHSVARWDGTAWSPVGTDGVNHTVRALASFDDGSGPALFVGGDLSIAGGVTVNRTGKWDGTRWSPLGTGLSSGSVRALAAFDDGSGSALYFGGFITEAGGAQARGVARWNGSSWSGVGSPVLGPIMTVNALAVFDDGTGAALYAGGELPSAFGSLRRWSGSSWTELGSGMQGQGSQRSAVHALAVFDAGSGPALFAGGEFASAGGVAATAQIARWNGTSWSSVGGGMSGSGTRSVRALAVFDDGRGAALYAAGTFARAGGVLVNGCARWDGSGWSAVGVAPPAIYALTVFDGQRGPELYAGGKFAGGIARWNGMRWAALGSGVHGSFAYQTVRALAVHAGELFVGGDFSISPEGDSFLARIGCGSKVALAR